MTAKTQLSLPGSVRPYLQNRLPDWTEARWFQSYEEACAIAPGAQIGWFDLLDKAHMTQAVMLAKDMKWLNSVYAGVDGLPLPTLKARSVVLTNGVGINAITIAEYVLLGMLNIAKSYREVVHAQARHEWLRDAPGKVELFGSRALIVGYGAIGQLVAERLQAFGVAVAAVRRSAVAGDGTAAGISVLGPTQWRARLPEFDWVILAVPATPETDAMIGSAELSAMKNSATLINVARGSVVDQAALTDALTQKTIGAAFLDVTSPEPLPADHPLWQLPNAHVSMHLSGRAQTKMFERAAERFLANLQRFKNGEPLTHQVDLDAGY